MLEKYSIAATILATLSTAIPSHAITQSFNLGQPIYDASGNATQWPVAAGVETQDVGQLSEVDYCVDLTTFAPRCMSDGVYAKRGGGTIRVGGARQPAVANPDSISYRSYTNSNLFPSQPGNASGSAEASASLYQPGATSLSFNNNVVVESPSLRIGVNYSGDAHGGTTGNISRVVAGAGAADIVTASQNVGLGRLARAVGYTFTDAMNNKPMPVSLTAPIKDSGVLHSARDWDHINYARTYFGGVGALDAKIANLTSNVGTISGKVGGTNPDGTHFSFARDGGNFVADAFGSYDRNTKTIFPVSGSLNGTTTYTYNFDIYPSCVGPLQSSAAFFSYYNNFCDLDFFFGYQLVSKVTITKNRAGTAGHDIGYGTSYGNFLNSTILDPLSISISGVDVSSFFDFTSKSTGQPMFALNLDRVDIDTPGLTPVPLPTSFLMMVFAFGVLGLVRQKPLA